MTKEEFLKLQIGDSVVVTGASAYSGMIGKITWISGILYPRSMACCDIDIPDEGAIRFHYWNIEHSLPVVNDLKDAAILAIGMGRKPFIIGVDLSSGSDMTNFGAHFPNIAEYNNLVKPYHLTLWYETDNIVAPDLVMVQLSNRPIILRRKISRTDIENFKGDLIAYNLAEMKIEMDEAMKEVKEEGGHFHEDK